MTAPLGAAAHSAPAPAFAAAVEDLPVLGQLVQVFGVNQEVAQGGSQTQVDSAALIMERSGDTELIRLNFHQAQAAAYSPVWPDGKKHSRNVYAKTREECEEKLKVLILEMKAEIAALRSGASTEYPDGVSPKKKAIATYLREHPGVTSKSLIARELQMDRSTVQRYYDEIREEFQRQG